MKIYKTSYSDLSLYEMCGFCWYLKNVKGEKQVSSPAMNFGTRLHSLLALYHKNMEEDIPEDLQPYLDEYAAAYDRDYQEVETFWKFPLFGSDITFTVKADLVANDLLVEHKTSSRPYSQEFVDKHRQATTYAYAWHQLYSEPERGIRYNIFLTQPKLHEPLLQILETTRNKEDFDEWEIWVREILRGIEADEFEPNPKARWHNYPACPMYKDRE